MKRTITTLAAMSVATLSSQASLILTGIVDGPLGGGTPKAIELYATADIADLSVYGVELVSNAGSSAGAVETAFSGSILAGEYYYVASEAPNFTAVFGFAPDITTGDANHNGDDDFYIYGPGAVLIDVWSGSDGVDNTGTATDILDSWAYRNDNTGPSTTFTASDWTIAAVDSLDGLDAAATAAAVPFGTFTVVPEPSSISLLGLAGLATLLRRRR
tara:strand:- start:86 stop:733 length:648 start_codon:yes stop_codon:yes gene_type:complete